jgi:hypothetical protein
MCLFVAYNVLTSYELFVALDGLHNVTVLQHSKMMIDRVKV